MSHITEAEAEVKDLILLKAAVIEAGFEWVEGKQNYEWFGRSVGNHPLPKGMTVDQLGKCEHVIRVPGSEYEIGVVKREASTWALHYDSWSTMGEKLPAAAGKVMQRYVRAATMQAFRRRGYSVTEQVGTDGKVRLEVRAR